MIGGARVESVDREIRPLECRGAARCRLFQKALGKSLYGDDLESATRPYTSTLRSERVDYDLRARDTATPNY